MPALDKTHESVKRALEKDGWTITFDPFRIHYLEVMLFADLGAERPLGALRGDRKIVVETKSFIGESIMQDFKLALGQYLLYRALLEEVAADHTLFMAIGLSVFEGFFQRKAIQYVLDRYEIALIVIDLEKEEIVQWTR